MWCIFRVKYIVKLLIYMNKIKILFVCMGNICRSPTAEGVFTKLVKDENLSHVFEIDSAGTHAYHEGEEPDLRSQKSAKERGIELHHLRARKVVLSDFDRFDYILAMDSDNYSLLKGACPEHHKSKIHYFLDFAPHLNVKEVPDPYYGGRFGFEKVLDLVEEASLGFLNSIRTQLEDK